MLFCRVIMGKMELVQPGSQQCHPSSENFDSGVDDLQNPRQYIVWNMNMNSHIYPEFVVSFMVSSNVEGDMLILLRFQFLDEQYAFIICIHMHTH